MLQRNARIDQRPSSWSQGHTSTILHWSPSPPPPPPAAPLETLVSKWVGQGEQQLASLFEAAAYLGPCIIFIDELDALAGSREGGGGAAMHEATRRMLSVLLRRLDGLDASERTALIGATNRKDDLDPALLSRFDGAATPQHSIPPHHG